MKNGEPCRVITTSLIEASVEVDFPLVMCAEAGLDSVAQAAGRCNREGKRPSENSFVWIFAPEDKWKAPPELATQAAAPLKETYDLKGKELDHKQILQMHHNARQNLYFPSQTIIDNFCIIGGLMQLLIIQFDNGVKRLINCLHYADHIGGLLRKLQPYTVQIPEEPLAALYKAGRIKLINENFEKQFYTLVRLDLYDEVAKLNWEETGFLKGEVWCFNKKSYDLKFVASVLARFRINIVERANYD